VGRGSLLRARDHVKVLKRQRPVEESRLLLTEFGCLRQIRILHGGLMRVEERKDQVSLWFCAISDDDGASKSALSLRRCSPLIFEPLDLVELVVRHSMI
jgi:hypothetical protein